VMSDEKMTVKITCGECGCATGVEVLAEDWVIGNRPDLSLLSDLEVKMLEADLCADCIVKKEKYGLKGMTCKKCRHFNKGKNPYAFYWDCILSVLGVPLSFVMPPIGLFCCIQMWRHWPACGKCGEW